MGSKCVRQARQDASSQHYIENALNKFFLDIVLTNMSTKACCYTETIYGDVVSGRQPCGTGTHAICRQYVINAVTHT